LTFETPASKNAIIPFSSAAKFANYYFYLAVRRQEKGQQLSRPGQQV
jgi:hypothetical protein